MAFWLTSAPRLSAPVQANPIPGLLINPPAQVVAPEMRFGHLVGNLMTYQTAPVPMANYMYTPRTSLTPSGVNTTTGPLTQQYLVSSSADPITSVMG